MGLMVTSIIDFQSRQEGGPESGKLKTDVNRKFSGGSKVVYLAFLEEAAMIKKEGACTDLLRFSIIDY